MHVRRDDLVEVITGDDKGTAANRTIAKVLRVIHKDDTVVVEGINRVYKHVRPSRQNMQGGRLSKEMPISASNVLLLCPRCNRGVRVGQRFLADGSKERFCKKCQRAGRASSLGVISPPRTAHATKT
jgi:large subunit ribosomal protein L24